MASKVVNLRRWKNGEVFNARDYVYERDLIVNLLNDHSDKIEAIENVVPNIATNTANIAANAANIAANTSDISDLKNSVTNLGGAYLSTETTSPQTVAGPVTFLGEVTLSGTNLDERLDGFDSSIEDLEGRVTTLEARTNVYVQDTEPETAVAGDLLFYTGGD